MRNYSDLLSIQLHKQYFKEILLQDVFEDFRKEVDKFETAILNVLEITDEVNVVIAEDILEIKISNEKLRIEKHDFKIVATIDYLRYDDEVTDIIDSLYVQGEFIKSLYNEINSVKEQFEWYLDKAFTITEESIVK